MKDKNINYTSDLINDYLKSQEDLESFLMNSLNNYFFYQLFSKLLSNGKKIYGIEKIIPRLIEDVKKCSDDFATNRFLFELIKNKVKVTGLEELIPYDHTYKLIQLAVHNESIKDSLSDLAKEFIKIELKRNDIKNNINDLSKLVEDKVIAFHSKDKKLNVIDYINAAFTEVIKEFNLPIDIMNYLPKSNVRKKLWLQLPRYNSFKENYANWVNKLCDELHLPKEVTDDCINMYNKIRSISPVAKALAALSIFTITCKKTHDRSQAEVARITGISDATLRKYWNRLMQAT